MHAGELAHEPGAWRHRTGPKMKLNDRAILCMLVPLAPAPLAPAAPGAGTGKGALACVPRQPGGGRAEHGGVGRAGALHGAQNNIIREFESRDNIQLPKEPA